MKCPIKFLEMIDWSSVCGEDHGKENSSYANWRNGATIAANERAFGSN